MISNNCQTFVNSFGIQFQWKNSIKEFIENKLYEKKFKNIIFKTHEELDDYILKNIENIIEPEDSALLMAFDRAFWLCDEKTNNCPTIL